MNTATRWLPPMGWGGTLALFGGAALLLAGAAHIALPALARATGWEPVLWWFVLGALVVFGPLLLVALGLLRGESLDGVDVARDRLRFRSMDAVDWTWALGALLAIGILTVLAERLQPLIFGEVVVTPAFLPFEPLGPGRYWILAAWIPFFVLNVVGEEILWRGVVLPRQEAALGAHAWLANAAGWLLFHAAFGVHLLLMLLPILLILPWVAQRRRNSWVAVVIHAGLNGPGFLAVALGLV